MLVSCVYKHVHQRTFIHTICDVFRIVDMESVLWHASLTQLSWVVDMENVILSQLSWVVDMENWHVSLAQLSWVVDMKNVLWHASLAHLSWVVDMDNILWHVSLAHLSWGCGYGKCPLACQPGSKSVCISQMLGQYYNELL